MEERKTYLKENHLLCILYILAQERQIIFEWLKLSENEGTGMARHRSCLQCIPVLIKEVDKYATVSGKTVRYYNTGEE